jgi:DNA-directed RNA polymerase subunit omega
MARVTIEDCRHKIPSAYIICVLAAFRAKQIMYGAPTKLPRGSHKETVIALQEIAQGLVDPVALQEELIAYMSRGASDFMSDAAYTEITEELYNLQPHKQFTHKKTVELAKKNDAVVFDIAHEDVDENFDEEEDIELEDPVYEDVADDELGSGRV